MAKKYIDAEQLTKDLERLCDIVCQYSKKQRDVMCGACPLGDAFELLDNQPAADVVEVNAFRNEVYRYIDDYKNDGADFLAGLETAVVIAEKMAGVYEEVEE